MSRQERQGDYSPRAEAHASSNDRTGLLLAITAFAVSFLALGLTLGLALFWQSEARHTQEDMREVKQQARLADDSAQRLKMFLEARGLTEKDLEKVK